MDSPYSDRVDLIDSNKRILLKRWENLPNSVLLSIFQNLGLCDRKNASLCCKNWSRMLNCPFLWRSLCCKFDSNRDDFLKIFCLGIKCLSVVRHCSTWLHNLTVRLDRVDIAEDLETLIIFCQSLTEAEDAIQLRKFKVEIRCPPQLYTDSGLMQDVIINLARFLRKQKCLTSFQSFLNLPTLYSALLIGAIPFNSSTTLNILETAALNDDIGRCPNIFQIPLSTFVNLRYLIIPYDTLGVDSLKSLASNCKFLELLVILVEFLRLSSTAVTFHRIRPKDWKKVSNKLPNVRVLFDFGCSIQNKVIKKIIPTTVPVIGVRCIYSVLTPTLLDHFLNFKEQIRYLEFYCVFESELLAFITSCSNLTVLKLLMVPATTLLDNLIDWITTENIGLRRLSIVFKELPEEEKPAIREKCNMLRKSHQCIVEIYSTYEEDRFLNRSLWEFPLNYIREFCLENQSCANIKNHLDA